MPGKLMHQHTCLLVADLGLINTKLAELINDLELELQNAKLPADSEQE
jgi:hypothetical protein